jgi:hypothetical protein
MAATLADLMVASSDPYEKAVVERFRLTSDLIDLMPWKRVPGLTYRYRVEEVAPGVSWRDVNEAYPESTGVIAPRNENIMILGGDVFIDNALLKNERRGGDAYNFQASQYDMKARSLARELERAILEGDDLVDPSEMMGLRRRLTGSQVILAGAGGATLTLTMIDNLLDAVDMSLGNVHLFMSKADRRTLTDRVNAIGTSVMITYTSANEATKRIDSYYGVPIHVVEDGWDASTLLGKDEDPGDGTQDTSSIYAVAFGDEMGVCGLIGNTEGEGSPLVEVSEVGETTSGPPGIMGRIETYPGLMMKHPRAAARLRGVL